MKIGLVLLLVDTFLTSSRMLEVVETNLRTHLPYVGVTIHSLTFAVAFLTGGVRRLATTRTGLFLLCLTGWMVLCIPFSSWRTGSVQTLAFYWIPALLGFLATGMVISLRQCRLLAMTVGLSSLAVAVSSFYFGVLKQQRLSFVMGTLGNANDLALVLLLGAPFLLIPLLDFSRGRLAKVLWAIAGLVVIVASFRTGSRAGLLALFCMLAILFLTRSGIGKLKMGLASLALGAILFTFIPSYSLQRYSTIFTDDPNLRQIYSSEAYGSTAQRELLLRQSVQATLEHPLLGVGPGVYAAAMAGVAQSQGNRAMWAVSHNSYTEVSSEMGIPGFIFYLAAIWCTFRDVFWLRKHTRRDPASNGLALSLLLSLAGLCVIFFFGSDAYMPWLPTLMGLTAVCRIAVDRDLGRQTAVAGMAPAAPPLWKPSPFMPAPAAGSTSSNPVMASPAPPPSQPVYTYRSLGRPQRVRR